MLLYDNEADTWKADKASGVQRVTPFYLKSQ